MGRPLHLCFHWSIWLNFVSFLLGPLPLLSPLTGSGFVAKTSRCNAEMPRSAPPRNARGFAPGFISVGLASSATRKNVRHQIPDTSGYISDVPDASKNLSAVIVYVLQSVEDEGPRCAAQCTADLGLKHPIFTPVRRRYSRLDYLAILRTSTKTILATTIVHLQQQTRALHYEIHEYTVTASSFALFTATPGGRNKITKKSDRLKLFLDFLGWDPL